jgi:substrate import-associated zinc metallohydrolase lipoprotein
MPDISTNMNYNLVPATYENSIDLAVLCKYLWFDVYDKIAGEEFLKTYGPRIILLVGSPAYNPTSGTEIVGLAEGGIKISLFKVNAMDINNFQVMNELYFHTMHHEFSHILHQTKTYPTEFNTISVGRYDANNWQYRGDEVHSLGYVTNYASMEYREDFAETIACYIVYTDTQWNRLMELAARGYATKASEDDLDAVYYSFYYYPENDTEQELVYLAERDVYTQTDDDGVVHKYWRNNRDKQGNRIVVYDVEDKDGIDGPAAIEQKVQIIRQWFRDAWNIDLDALREEVQNRQATYDMNELRKLVYDIQ